MASGDAAPTQPEGDTRLRKVFSACACSAGSARPSADRCASGDSGLCNSRVSVLACGSQSPCTSWFLPLLGPLAGYPTGARAGHSCESPQNSLRHISVRPFAWTLTDQAKPSVRVSVSGAAQWMDWRGQPVQFLRRSWHPSSSVRTREFYQCADPLACIVDQTGQFLLGRLALQVVLRANNAEL